jgi:hypothetical protein
LERTTVMIEKKLLGALILDIPTFILATKHVSIALLTHVIPSL